ncbi:PREDICTED: disintegrin and metalloproteinase domain-containing protein 9-like, partial [Gekko japonicus]|uniref:Disintegrin and metalloproteinase domain-containing protein 9-like n=1 Tax=Gekko japonicus TaxID=146911 RepID=A0ABM1KLD0_GEKJA
GHVRIGRLTYEIRPVENSPTFQHLIYLAAPEQHEPCRGILEDQDELERNQLGSGKPESPPADHSSKSLMKDPGDAAATYLEYYVVCDRSVIYEEIGLHLILIGMEMWTERDFSTVSQNKLAKTLERFYNYAIFELQRHVHFDHAAIYTRLGEEGSFGKSWGERLCLSHHVSVSAVKASPSTTRSGVSAAHELGHSLGFLHDDVLGGDMTGCDCNCVSKPGRCIMYSGVVECHRLSNCSRKAYYELLRKPGKSCLRNLPKEAVVKKECGNSVVEGDEECDCGLVQLAEEGTLCREAATDCDLPEYCTGASADCPLDVHKQDGERCGAGDTCFMGQCSDLSQHCREIFGKGAKRAPWSCFKKVNTQGDRTGNCGTGRPGYKKCEEEHAVCGRIQCTNIKRVPVLPTRQAVLQTPVGNIWCWGVEFHEGLGVYDVGVTPDGSSCGAGKVCNSKQNCHCANGWAPPFCEGKGYGGSVDSGPPPKPKPPTYAIVGFTIGGVCLLLTVLLIKKYIVTPWLASKEMEEDTDLDDLEPTEESEAEEALPFKKPIEETG